MPVLTLSCEVLELLVLGAGLGSAQLSAASPGPAVVTSLDCLYYRVTFDEREEEEKNPLLVPLEAKSVLEERQTSLWFGKVGPYAGSGG